MLVVILGWVLFRASDLPHALGFAKAMFDPAAFGAPRIGLQVIANREVLLAAAAGVVFAAPTLPWLLDRLRAARLARAEHLPARLDTHHVHALSTPMLVAGLVLSLAHLAGSSLNPFLYFRF